HWTAANAQLGAGHDLVLTGGITRATLETQRGELSAARDLVTDWGIDRALAREQLTVLIAQIQTRVVEFNARVRADLPDSPFARVLPAAFAVGDAEGPVRDALRQMSRLWTRINAIAPVPAGLVLPLALKSAYTLAAFDADREALRVAYGTLSTADVELRVAREERNDLQNTIYDILKSYRAKVPTVFAAGDALVESLPALTPSSGHTPDTVAVTGTWDAAATKAKLTWTESTDADLDHYDVRGVAGDTYVAADETVLASVPAAEAREFFTDFALSVPGLTAGYKVYVVLKAGNEHGSEPVFVTRG
ncbi:MAG: hypothetical protein ACOYMN_03580, partial [Roseimicrobium sp.]